MRKFTILIVAFFIFFISNKAHAQQQPQYTQFMFNKLALNPGYVVADDIPCISCLHRSQWVGLEGSPNSQSLNFRYPMPNKNVGFGASINRDAIGPSESITGGLIYGYKLEFPTGKLGIGLKGSLKAYRVDWDMLETVESGDNLSATGSTNLSLFNFGAGAYYYTPKFYVGFSVPALVSNDLSGINAGSLLSSSDFNRETVHMYLMSGFVFNLKENIRLKPALLMKYTPNAPFDADFNASFIFHDKFWLGLSYRVGGFSDSGFGESIDAFVQLQIGDYMRLGLSYDFTLSKVRSAQSGTYELSVEYCFQNKNFVITNPRFF